VAGTYQWVAKYSGDINNPALGPTKLGDEPQMIFQPLQPTNVVTNSSLCQFNTDPSSPTHLNTFNLIFIQSTGGYQLNASNPGQFYDNAFISGSSGDMVASTLTIPYPFVTQGNVPIHIYTRYTITGTPPMYDSSGKQTAPGTLCFTPDLSSDITSSFTITYMMTTYTAPNEPHIVLGDYGMSPTLQCCQRQLSDHQLATAVQVHVPEYGHPPDELHDDEPAHQQYAPEREYLQEECWDRRPGNRQYEPAWRARRDGQSLRWVDG
jgi:hypothetical protein